MLKKQPQSNVLQYFKSRMATSWIGERTPGRVSVGGENVASAVGELPCWQTHNGGTHCCSSGHKWIHIEYLPVRKSLCGNLRRAGNRVPLKCNHGPLGKAGGTGALWQPGGGKKGWLLVCLLGRHGACHEVVFRGLGDKAFIPLSRDQSSTIACIPFSEECLSKLLLSRWGYVTHHKVLGSRTVMSIHWLSRSTCLVAKWSANGEQNTSVQKVSTRTRNTHTNITVTSYNQDLNWMWKHCFRIGLGGTVSLRVDSVKFGWSREHVTYKRANLTCLANFWACKLMQQQLDWCSS